MSTVEKAAAEDLAEKLQEIIEGQLTGDAAAAVLRAAVIQCHESESAVEAMRAFIGKAERMLVYGSTGRPEREYPSCFGFSTPG